MTVEASAVDGVAPGCDTDADSGDDRYPSGASIRAEHGGRVPRLRAEESAESEALFVLVEVMASAMSESTRPEAIVEVVLRNASSACRRCNAGSLSMTLGMISV